jgi:cytochrome c oxidase cbb3-type subunit 1
MVMFGAIYYITPRLVGCEWLSPWMIKMHFFGTAYGAGTIIALFLFGGLATGFVLNEPVAENMAFYNVNGIANAYMPVKTYIGYFVFGIAQIVFAFHFVLMRFRIGQQTGEPTLLQKPGEAH